MAESLSYFFAARHSQGATGHESSHNPVRAVRAAFCTGYSHSYPFAYLSKTQAMPVEEVQGFAVQRVRPYNFDHLDLALGGFTPKQHLDMATKRSTSQDSGNRGASTTTWQTSVPLRLAR